jgi:arginine decarboxylase
VPLVVDEAWGAHLAFHPDLPMHALAAGADLVVSSTHKIVGSLTQSAIVHVAGDLIPDHLVDRAVTLTESTSPNSLLCASLDAARRLAVTRGRELLEETIAGLEAARAAIRALPGLDVLDESIAGRPGVHGYDPLRLAIDVRGTGATGYELARVLAEDDIIFELYGENVVVAVFGMAEDVGPQAERLVAALAHAIERLGTSVLPASPVRALASREQEPFAPPPPWGELAMPPREAFLGPQEAVPFADAAGRIAAESLAAYPPGVPNVLPGERLTEPTIEYVQATLEHGGMLRGAVDRKLRTIRVVIEA